MMEIDQVLYEILSEVRKLSAEQSAVNAKLENCIKTTDRQDSDIRQLQVVANDTHRHSLILKAMVWVYGLVIAGFIGKFLTSKFLS